MLYTLDATIDPSNALKFGSVQSPTSPVRRPVYEGTLQCLEERQDWSHCDQWTFSSNGVNVNRWMSSVRPIDVHLQRYIATAIPGFRIQGSGAFSPIPNPLIKRGIPIPGFFGYKNVFKIHFRLAGG